MIASLTFWYYMVNLQITKGEVGFTTVTKFFLLFIK